MAALVQTYPQQTTTVASLQSRSPANMIPAQAQANQQYVAAQQAQRNFSGGMAASGVYRGSNAPIQPYAFTSTPSLNTTGQWQQYGNGYRTTSSPAVPTQGVVQGHDGGRSRHTGSSSVSHAAYNHTMGTSKGGSRDDSALVSTARTNSQAPRPQSTYMAGSTTPQMTFAQAASAKTTPDRYRRPALQQQQSRQSSTPSGSGMATISHLYNGPGSNDHKSVPMRSRNLSSQSRPNSHYGVVDDMQLSRPQMGDDSNNMRLRRRSMHSLDSADYPKPLTPQEFSHSEESPSPRPDRVPTPKNNEKSLRLVSSLAPPSDANMHVRNGSAESLVSSRSSQSRPSSSANRSVPTPTANPSSSSSSPNPDDGSLKHDHPKTVNVPPRSSSSDAARRQPTPSPLSKPVTMSTESSPQKPSSSVGNVSQQSSASKAAATVSNANAGSPAAQHLAAINSKGTKSKSKTSRLRRAFSFGSAADFRKAAGSEPTIPEQSVLGDAARSHKEPTAEELYDAEQAAIAKKQEEGGIGNNIYGGRLFSGSTDNISISSTASSASIMIRKMGRGMKKSTRNLVGLFRPKSVIGVPAADALAPEASQAAVSMITVEAERVNVNADPRTQNGGGTGFPHLERNSMDISNTPSMVSERAGSSGTDSAGRKSIVGGDRERAEVLAAVRKGILKHNRSGSPAREGGGKPFELPAIPSIADSPVSTAPSTPNDDAQSHKRSGSVAIGSEDYFMTALRLRQDSKSAPGTPSGGTKRNATFSQRIIFHDTWPSGEYDRRGEIATCNRLTPMLAQQIKEELNTFKMASHHGQIISEMEVHENSKIYTHFF
ncbi:Protein BNI4 [Colletotrichum spinosum]|uniref:Protein BNI4 n=1 Tax=Colletotrichum spinosum TaxID=1347390 RepID=A0A4R8QA85_9PEZI|nr:Protein BNI4 [Colletotrichum spinosum]